MLPRDQPIKSHQLGGSRDSLLHMLKPPRCDVDDDETDESDKNEEVDGTRAHLPPKVFCIRGKSIHVAIMNTVAKYASCCIAL